MRRRLQSTILAYVKKATRLHRRSYRISILRDASCGTVRHMIRHPVVWLLFASALLVGAGCGTPASPKDWFASPDGNHVRVVARGTHSSVAERSIRRIESDGEKRLIESAIGSSIPDASPGSVLWAVFAGQQPTAGYSVEIVSVTASTVTVGVEAPDPGGIVATVITYPYAIVSAPSEAYRIRWRSAVR